jgi:YVTN family beta-propeller protein
VLVGLFAAAAGAWPRVYVTEKHSNSATVIDGATNTVIGSIAVGTSPSEAAASPDGRVVYVANASDKSNSVTAIDVIGGKVLGTMGVQSQPLDIAFAPDGLTAYVTNTGSNTVSIIDTQQGKTVGQIGTGSSPAGIAVTPDGSHVYVADADNLDHPKQGQRRLRMWALSPRATIRSPSPSRPAGTRCT